MKKACFYKAPHCQKWLCTELQLFLSNWTFFATEVFSVKKFYFWLSVNCCIVPITSLVMSRFLIYYSNLIMYQLSGNAGYRVNFTNIFARLLCKNEMRSFFWQMVFGKRKLIWQISPYILGKFHWCRMLVKLNGNFFALATFRLAHKGW